MDGPTRVLLIVSGGIAAYKSLELTRLLREQNIAVRAVLTEGGRHFVTPLSLGALTEDKVYTDLWSLTDESTMGHIELSRQADLVVVAPASADILAKMAVGLADDLATTLLLATDKPVLVAPAMNVRMWHHAATQANIATLTARGIDFVGPDEGAMACGEFGLGRMAQPAAIKAAIDAHLQRDQGLKGLSALVTSGPTQEPIDAVRYLGNRSSGQQGHAIAAALARRGAATILVSGPTALPDPAGVTTIRVNTAAEMLAACESALPVDIAVCAAAVADWRVAPVTGKLKKNGAAPSLTLEETPDILARIAQAGNRRPTLVIGFAAETENLLEQARAKCMRKSCDWIVANDVGGDAAIFGGPENEVHLIKAETLNSAEHWPRQSKTGIANRLTDAIFNHFSPLFNKEIPA